MDAVVKRFGLGAGRSDAKSLSGMQKFSRERNGAEVENSGSKNKTKRIENLNTYYKFLCIR